MQKIFKWTRLSGSEEDAENEPAVASGESSSHQDVEGGNSGGDDGTTNGDASGSLDQLFPDLSMTTRIQGFILFAILGFISNFMSWIALGMHHYPKYSILMTMGNLMSLGSTLMLMGPKRQCRSMFDETRQTATTVYLCSIGATLVAAFVFQSTFLCVLCCIVEYLAFVWYSLSYIPFGRKMAKSCLSGVYRMVIPV
jgi:hypothetical protein